GHVCAPGGLAVPAVHRQGAAAGADALSRQARPVAGHLARRRLSVAGGTRGSKPEIRNPKSKIRKHRTDWDFGFWISDFGPEYLPYWLSLYGQNDDRPTDGGATRPQLARCRCRSGAVYGPQHSRLLRGGR